MTRVPAGYVLCRVCRATFIHETAGRDVCRFCGHNGPSVDPSRPLPRGSGRGRVTSTVFDQRLKHNRGNRPRKADWATDI